MEQFTPFWMDPLAPFGSAVRVVVGSSGKVSGARLVFKDRRSRRRPIQLNWMETGRGKREEMDNRVFAVTDQDGKKVAELHVQSSYPDAWSSELVGEIETIIRDLGEKWHELKI